MKTMQQDMSGRVAIVTGATSGIGKEVACELAEMANGTGHGHEQRGRALASVGA